MSAASKYHLWSTCAAASATVLMATASGSPELAALGLPTIALSWAVFRRTGRSPVPRWMVNAMLLATTLNLVRLIASDTHRSEDSIARLSEYLIQLLIIKLFESRRPRDQAQAIALGAMAAIGATLTSVSLAVACLAALYAVFAGGAVILFQFASAEARARGSKLLWDEDPRGAASSEPTSRAPDADRAWTRPLIASIASMIPVVIVGTVIVFIVMPRDIGQQMLGGLSNRSGGGVSGFSDEVKLGIDGVIRESDDIVMDVTLESGGRTVVQHWPQYLRGAVLDRYDAENGAWSRSRRRDSADLSTTAPAPPTSPERRDLMHQRVRVRNRTTAFLFSLWKPVVCVVSGTQHVAVSPADSTIRFPGTGALRYEVDSDPNATENPADYGPVDDTFRSGPVRDYAAEVLRKRNLDRDPTLVTDPEDERRVDVLRQHLSSVCQYTLDLEAPPPGRDPIEWFLLDRQRGACEYFASALTAMCRSVGIRARVITGFMTNEVDEVSGTYIVRSKHAHAWVEALVPGPTIITDDGESHPTVVWKTLDAVPPARIDAATGFGASIASRVRRGIERLESVWFNVVIGFDNQRQARLFGAPSGSNAVVDYIIRHLPTIRGNPIARVVSAAAAFMIGFVVIVSPLFLGRAIWRSRARHARSSTGAAPASAEARRASRIMRMLDRTLRRAGVPRPAWRGALDHARSIAWRDAEAGALAERIATRCYAARFGAAPPPDPRSVRADLRRIGAGFSASRRAR